MLEAFLAPGSELWMFNEVPEKEREKKLTDGGLDLSGLTNIRLVHKEGNAVIRRHLESLPLETFDSVSMQNFLAINSDVFSRHSTSKHSSLEGLEKNSSVMSSVMHPIFVVKNIYLSLNNVFSNGWFSVYHLANDLNANFEPTDLNSCRRVSGRFCCAF